MSSVVFGPRFNAKAFSASFLYALRHWSIDMPSLPNMMAIIPSALAWSQGTVALVVYKLPSLDQLWTHKADACKMGREFRVHRLC